MLSFEPIIKKSHKARNLIIKITPDSKVIVTIPHGISLSKAYDFLNLKNNWINERLDKLKSKLDESLNFSNNSIIPIFETDTQVERIVTKVANTKVFINNNKILVFSNKHTKESEIKKAIIKSLITEFRKNLLVTVEKYNTEGKFKYHRIAIKDNRTNWGSCSTKGNLNFNWKLIFAPKGVYEYVVVHELCHLIEHNHSKAFWNLVKSICPDFETKRKWLKRNGHKLSVI
ncbi:M48 family metallopeptidase [Candidatus Dojkabacteria bacterium]|nr:M48 family metallopeptidase [Candidatus Dojkabacteria bacterium]